ncbi:hypothetical protein D3C72_1004700 [compost metagenome]
MNGGTVGFVEAGFEYVRNAEFLCDADVFVTSTQGKVVRLKNVDAAEQYERKRIGDRNIF